MKKFVKEKLNEVGPIAYPGGEFGGDEDARKENWNDNKHRFELCLNIRISTDMDGERTTEEDLKRKFKNGELKLDRGFILDQTNKILGVIEEINN